MNFVIFSKTLGWLVSGWGPTFGPDESRALRFLTRKDAKEKLLQLWHSGFSDCFSLPDAAIYAYVK